MTTIASELPISTERNKATPWGFWATFGLSSIVCAAFFIIEIVVVVAFVVLAKVRDPEIQIVAYSRTLSSNGFCLAISTIASGPICTMLIILFAKLRKNLSLADYLGLKKPTTRELVKWLLLLGLLLVCSDSLTLALKRPIVPPFMQEAYRTAGFTPALWFALVVVAPVFEEILVRGFVFQGIRYSRLGPVGAVGLTALGWAIVHVQYDAYGMISIFVGGSVAWSCPAQIWLALCNYCHAFIHESGRHD